MSLVAATMTDSLSNRTALLGIATPLSDISVATGQTGTVLAIVSTRYGALTVDLGSGAAVHGNGSTHLWLNGSLAEINAKLAMLSYLGGTAGTDQFTITLLDSQGEITTALRISLDVLPLTAIGPTNALISIDHGTITLDTIFIDGPVIALTQPHDTQASTTGILIDTTIGKQSTLLIRNDETTGAVVPRLAVAGRVELDGASSFSGNGTAITLAEGATLCNEGSMSIAAHAAQFTGTGRIINDGTITIVGDGSDQTPVRIGPAIDGTGNIDLTTGASLILAGTVATTQTTRFGDGANTLHLTAPATFAGVVEWFSQHDTIVLDGVSASAGIYSAKADANTGTLTLTNGQQTVATLKFSATEPGATFQLGADAAGDTTIRLSPIADSAPGCPEVYRFFNTTSGTQMLTADRAERDAIIGARSDLRYEGVGFQSVIPDQDKTDTVAIYRFFDTSNGNHFLTESAAERDTLLASQPNLVSEPASTLFEHANAKPGDLAVYRFFDQTSGAHFFTASADERATILSTRPDMTAEGIAFYAPA